MSIRFNRLSPLPLGDDPKFIIGFTGTKESLPDAQQRALMNLVFSNRRYISAGLHGDCIGADAFFHSICKHGNDPIYTICYPPINPKYRAFTENDETRPTKMYLQRNLDIARQCNILIACPQTEWELTRSGTWSTVRYARVYKKPIILIFPDGGCILDSGMVC